jgi:hypothetical protein
MMLRRILVVGTVAAGLAAAVASASLTPVRADNNGKAEDGEGKYANLSAQWWEWVYSQPAVNVGGTNTNPVIDSTGAYASAGQPNGQGPGNKYFFLCGTFGGPAVVRTCNVPAGKDLFFPILNLETDNASAPPTNFSVPQLRANAAAFFTSPPAMTSTIDGQSVEIFRTKSPTFSYTLPAQNSIYDYLGLFGPQFQGTVSPAEGDGFWSFVPAPSKGLHAIHIVATGFLDVTYHLNVQ